LGAVMSLQSFALAWHSLVGGMATSQALVRAASARATMSAARATSCPTMAVAHSLKVSRTAAARNRVAVEKEHRQHYAHHCQMAVAAEEPN
jgi:hypothetical protein